MEISDLQKKTDCFYEKTDDSHKTDSDTDMNSHIDTDHTDTGIFQKQADGQQIPAARPVFVKIDGGNHRATMEFSSIRESILGPSPSENGSITSGQRMAGDRIANRQMQRTRPASPDPSEKNKSIQPQRRKPVQNRPVHSRTTSGQSINRQNKNRPGKNTPENAVRKQTVFQSLKRRIRRNRFRGTYYIGATGAVFGMLAACVVATAVVSFIPRLYGLICVLLPVWEVSGYLLFNGRREKSPVPVIIIFLVSFAGVILIGFGGDIMTPVISQGKTLTRTWQTFKGNTGDLHYWGTTLYHALIPVVFVILGMAITVPKLLKKPVHRKNRQSVQHKTH